MLSWRLEKEMGIGIIRNLLLLIDTHTPAAAAVVGASRGKLNYGRRRKQIL